MNSQAAVIYSRSSIPCEDFERGWRKRKYRFVQPDYEVSDYIRRINDLNDADHVVEEGEFMYLLVWEDEEDGEIMGVWGVQGTPFSNRPAWALYLKGWYTQ